MNLNNGDAGFAAIPSMQDINLKGNAMFLNPRVDSSNLIPKADNPMPNVY